MLYESALQQMIPFFKWHTWIETSLQKEVLKQLFEKKKQDELRASMTSTKRKSRKDKKEKMRKSLAHFLNE